MNEKEKYYYPVNGWNCLYYRSNGLCNLGEKGALANCEDAQFLEEKFEEDEDQTPQLT